MIPDPLQVQIHGLSFESLFFCSLEPQFTLAGIILAVRKNYIEIPLVFCVRSRSRKVVIPTGLEFLAARNNPRSVNRA